MADVSFSSSEHKLTESDVPQGEEVLQKSSKGVTVLSSGQYQQYWTPEAAAQNIREGVVAFLSACDAAFGQERAALSEFGRNVDLAIAEFARVNESTGDELTSIQDSITDREIREKLGKGQTQAGAPTAQETVTNAVRRPVSVIQLVFLNTWSYADQGLILFRRTHVGRTHYAGGAPWLTSLSIPTSTPKLGRTSNKGGAAIASSSEAITRLSNGQYERFWTDEAGPQALRNAFIAFLGACGDIATNERDTLRSFGRNVDQAIEDFAAVEQATGDELKALRDSMGDPSVYTSPTPPSASPAGGSAPSTDPATTAGTNGAPTQEAQTEF